ncbi:MAG: GNAT family N-acetyltransferase [Halobacteriovoraceae bacterium]|jgi:hypothetical protein|nr:GNAT family N-acetyltransferase [Halobacteriovoraceae bacterium]MBT5095927.1 GNAT family N-acetyltransferase [Halobacteriovoraceae bacterium]
MDLVIEKAQLKDVEELLGLYISIYGDDYPLSLGTQKKVMVEAISDNDRYLWLVMRDTLSGVLAGSTIIEMDLEYCIGKVTGVTVSPTYRGQKIAQNLISFGVEQVLRKEKKVHSLYATARTEGLSSQQMFLKNGFIPLGIFPNCRKIKSYETLNLLGIFSDEGLARRADVQKIPENLAAIYQTVNSEIGIDKQPGVIEACPITDFVPSETLDDVDDFEFIDAPQFIQRRFDNLFAEDKESVFYPFHHPNLLIASQKLDLEIYASFNKKDHYCVLITANKSIKCLRNNFKQLMFSMKELGIYYVETLVRVDYFDAICFLSENRFIPSAIYPAMREEEGMMHDYVLLTRTMVPLDFSETTFSPRFLPYVNQYTKQWMKLNLSTVMGDS